MIKIVMFFTVVFFAAPAHCKIKVVTSTTDIKAIVQAVGGDEVVVDSICKGTQDPHFIEVKPSYISKVSKADLVIAVGLGLERSWLPGIIRGARNPKVGPGANGYLELGPQLNPIEVTSAESAKLNGHVHPEGNSHIFLDPVRVGHAAMLVAERLGRINESKSKEFLDKARAFQIALNEKTKVWETKLSALSNRKVITYHKTLNYFLDRFKLESVMTMEPEPGTPPTASHILKVLGKVKEQKIKLILVENYFDVKVAQRVRDESPGLQVATVPVSIEGTAELTTFDKLFDTLVNIIAEKGK